LLVSLYRVICLLTKLLIASSSSGPSVIAVKLEAEESFRTAAKLFCILQNITLTKVATFS